MARLSQPFGGVVFGGLPFGGNGFIPPPPAPAPAPAPTPAPLAPFIQGPLPHDDYDYGPDYRPWYQRAKDFDTRREARLQAMREEIGLIQTPKAVKAKLRAAVAVEKATLAITKRLDNIPTEKCAFDLVAAFEREYRKAFRSVLAKARAEDAAEVFRAEVRAKVAKQARERRLAIERDDADVLMLLSYFV